MDKLLVQKEKCRFIKTDVSVCNKITAFMPFSVSQVFRDSENAHQFILTGAFEKYEFERK